MVARCFLPLTSEFNESEPIAGNYLVPTYPPLASWHPEQAGEWMDALKGPASPGPLNLYLHIPFCQRKCDYCHYLSLTNQPATVIDRYVERLLEEMERYASFPALRDRRIHHAFIGGGTPSLLTPAQILRLGEAMNRLFAWHPASEISFECAPRSVRPEGLEAMKRIGVTRVSMGVQSFDNVLLKLNGRIHLTEDILRAYRLMEDAGLDWINLDLMVGLVGEKPERWKDTVKKTVALAPASVTIYQTEIACNTQLYREIQSASLPAAPVDWDTKRARLLYGFEQLEQAGYTIINAYQAVRDPERHRCRYQQSVWSGADLLGLGLGAFGYLGGVHYQNEGFLKGYHDELARGRLPVQRALRLSRWDQFVREFVLQLKLGRVSRPLFLRKFGGDLLHAFSNTLADLERQGLVVCGDQEITLTRNGLIRADQLLPSFYDREYQSVPYA